MRTVVHKHRGAAAGGRLGYFFFWLLCRRRTIGEDRKSFSQQHRCNAEWICESRKDDHEENSCRTLQSMAVPSESVSGFSLHSPNKRSTVNIYNTLYTTCVCSFSHSAVPRVWLAKYKQWIRSPTLPILIRPGTAWLTALLWHAQLL